MFAQSGYHTSNLFPAQAITVCLVGLNKRLNWGYDNCMYYLILVLLLLTIPIFWLLPLYVAIPVYVVVVLKSLFLYWIVRKSTILKVHTGLEGLIGERGKVVEPLTPFGTIIVKGEYWKANSLDDNIQFDENIEIVGNEGLTLKVKREDH